MQNQKRMINYINFSSAAKKLVKTEMTVKDLRDKNQELISVIGKKLLKLFLKLRN